MVSVLITNSVLVGYYNDVIFTSFYYFVPIKISLAISAELGAIRFIPVRCDTLISVFYVFISVVYAFSFIIKRGKCAERIDHGNKHIDDGNQRIITGWNEPKCAYKHRDSRGYFCGNKIIEGSKNYIIMIAHKGTICHENRNQFCRKVNPLSTNLLANAFLRGKTHSLRKIMYIDGSKHIDYGIERKMTTHKNVLDRKQFLMGLK